MSATALKGLTTAAEEFACRERTAANELPEELAQISGSFGCPGLRDSPAGGGWKKTGRPKQAAAATKTRRLARAAVSFMDDGHPTVLAAAFGPNLAR